MAELEIQVRPAFGKSPTITGRTLAEGLLATGAAAVSLTSGTWPTQFERLETTSAVVPTHGHSNKTTTMDALTPLKYDALEVKIDQMHLELSRAITALDARIDRIAAASAGGQLRQFEAEPVVSDFEREAFQAAANAKNEELASVLDRAADEALISQTLLDLAREAMGSGDSLLRTAAARLMAIADPTSAKAIIPGLIERADGPTSKHILEVALRTATS
jgi:hypothetical protein